MHFEIIITSDIICGFCPLGLKRLRRAIDIWHATAARDDTFDLQWRPFYLNAPRGMGKRERMLSRFTEERAAILEQKTREKGEREGVKIGFEGHLPRGGTRDAHRLIAFAERKHPESYQAIVDTLFISFHEREEDVSDVEVLVRCAAEAGMPEGEVQPFLESNEAPTREETDIEAKNARDRGIAGVPHFQVNGKWIVDGAYEEGEWLTVFAEIREMSGPGAAGLAECQI